MSVADTPAEAIAAAADLLTEAMTVYGRQPSPGELSANAGLALLMVEAAEPFIRADERKQIIEQARQQAGDSIAQMVENVTGETA